MARMAMERQDNVALLIDADNASDKHLEAVLKVLAGLGSVNIRRAYGNWQSSKLSGWEMRLSKNAIEPVQQFDVAKGKNATDIRLTVDAMELLFSRRVQAFALMSSDSDFAPLVTRLRQEGMRVYGFGKATTPASFRDSCTKFETLPPGQSSSDATRQRACTDNELKLFIAAITDCNRDNAGYASLSEVGKKVQEIEPGFKLRKGVHRRPSSLFRAAPEHFELAGTGSAMRVRIKGIQ
jgi:uncharacterized protein (TIGR00288 family)